MKNFQTPRAQYVSLSDVIAAPGTISGKVAFMEDYCNAYCLSIYPKGSYTEDAFKEECGYGENISSSLSFNYTNELSPMTDYVIVYTAVKAEKKDNNGWVTWEISEFVGEVYTQEVTTMSYALNQCEAELDISTVESGFYKLSTTLARIEGCGAFYGGAVETSSLTNGIEKYVESWFTATNSWGGYNYSMFTSFYDQWEGTYKDSATLVAVNLKMNTAYTMWVVALDEAGRLGKLVTREVSTRKAEFTGSATVSATITPAENGKSVSVDLTLSSDCAQVYYVNEDMESKSTPFTKEEIETSLLNEYSSGWGNSWEASGKYSINYLSKNNTYYLHLLPVDADGNLGKILTVEYSTAVKDIEFNGDAKVTSVASEVHFENGRPIYDVTVTIVDADGYVEQSVSVGTLQEQGLTSLEGQARYALDYNSDKEPMSESATFNITLYGESSYHFAIPFKNVDGARVYGTPVRLLLEFVKQD